MKTFIIGVVVGTLFGATFLGALSHLLVIGLAVVGAVTAALAVERHRLPGGRARKDLRRANAERASSDL
jgi:mannose/fructose/N-acetylgalactosamine-specific phosphotransferase system component IIC